MLWPAVVVTIALMSGASDDEPRGRGPERTALHEEAGRRDRTDVARSFQDRETITAIQIQGNTATSDEEVRRLADVRVGMPLESQTIEDVAARLRATKRFESVEVRKRFASIADPSQIVLVIVVDEGPVHIEMTGDPDRPTRVVRTRRPNILFLPVLNVEDGYGLTYGARFALADPAGRNSRLSFPLTWGGTKEAAAELDKTFGRGPLHRLVAGGSISRRTNPFFEENDDRARVWVRGEREMVRARAGGGDRRLPARLVLRGARSIHACRRRCRPRHAARSVPAAKRGLRPGGVGPFQFRPGRRGPRPSSRRAATSD